VYFPDQRGGIGRYEVYYEIEPLSYLRGTSDVRYVTADSCEGKDSSDVLLMPHQANWPAGFVSLTNGRDAMWWVIETSEIAALHTYR
jgi:hypothetical protein